MENAHGLEEIIEALNCFKTRQPKCGDCKFNPAPGQNWPYGCIRGQGEIAEAVQTILRHGDQIHCKDCKHRPEYRSAGNTQHICGPGYNEETMEEDTTCPFLCSDSFYNRRPRDDFFCAYGER